MERKILKIIIVEDDDGIHLEKRIVCPEYNDTCKKFHIDSALDCYKGGKFTDEEGNEEVFEPCDCFCPMINGLN